jgi:hypothetical protein
MRVDEETTKVKRTEKMNSPVHPLQKSRYILYTIAGRQLRDDPCRMAEATGEPEKNPAAVALGRLGGLKGRVRPS